MSRRTLQLIVAEGCNLRCAYCFEHHKTKRRMTFDTAREAVTQYLSEDDGFAEVMIDFMGGEPMLAFPLIRQVVEYVTSRPWPKPYHFSMSTNGTLFTRHNMPWFIEHKRVFTPMLSLDGLKEVHDANRSQSYDRVIKNIDFFREHWPFQSVRMTVNRAALRHLADGVFSILALGLPVEVTLSYEDDWSREEGRAACLRIFESELARLVDFFTEFPILDPPMLVDLPIASLPNSSSVEATRWCGAGDAMRAVGIDGRPYPCHRFLPFSAGEGLEQAEYAVTAPTWQTNRQCDECPVRSTCPTCQAQNWESTGSGAHRVSNKCEFLKLQMVATAALHLSRLHALSQLQPIAHLSDTEVAEATARIAGVKTVFRILGDMPRHELRPYVDGRWPAGPGWEQRLRWHDAGRAAVA